MSRGGPSIYGGEGPNTRGAPKRGVVYHTSDTRVTVWLWIAANKACKRALEAKLCSAFCSLFGLQISFRGWGWGEGGAIAWGGGGGGAKAPWAPPPATYDEGHNM